MYRGVYKLRIDGKGRIPLPGKILESFQGKSRTLYLIRGVDRCVTCYDQKGWDSYKSRVIAVQVAEKDKDRLFSELIGNAQKARVDWKRRVTIDRHLLDWAGITLDRAVVVGCGDFFEIWDPNEYEEMKKDLSKFCTLKLP